LRTGVPRPLRDLELWSLVVLACLAAGGVAKSNLVVTDAARRVVCGIEPAADRSASCMARESAAR
jgi:hypothetical protein